MKLKEYQERTLGEVKRFLEQLVLWRGKARQGDEWLFDFAEKAWEKAGVGRMYLKKKDGLQHPLPSFCLKVPTGGGKTLLAVKTIDLVQSIYRQKQAGLVVWIVPTQQIYRQTLLRLRDRTIPIGSIWTSCRWEERSFWRRWTASLRRTLRSGWRCSF